MTLCSTTAIQHNIQKSNFTRLASKHPLTNCNTSMISVMY